MIDTHGTPGAQEPAPASPDADTLLMLADMANYAADARGALTQFIHATPPAWQDRVLRWLDDCDTWESTAISREALRAVIADLVTWRNAQTSFRLQEGSTSRNYNVDIVGDLGGAAVLGHLITRLVELVQRHDADLMLEIAQLALDVNRHQVAAIGKLIAAR